MGVVKLSTAGILDYSKTSNFLSGNAPVSFGAFDLLETVNITTTGVTTITLTGLGSYSDYKSLQIRAVAQKEETGTNDSFRFYCNNDTGSNYAWHRLEANGSSVASEGYANSIPFASEIPGSSIGQWGAYVIDIADFSSSNKKTTFRTLNGWASATQPRIQFRSMLWNNTAALTELDIEIGAGTSTYKVGTRMSLFGVK